MLVLVKKTSELHYQGFRRVIGYPSDGENPNELDEGRMSELTEFAEGYGCKPQRVDDEKRIYFSKISA
jgi:hypothetical protein